MLFTSTQHNLPDNSSMEHILLRVQLGQLCCVCSYALHVVQHKVNLLQGRGHHVDKVVTDGFDDGLCCLLLREASPVEVQSCLDIVTLTCSPNLFISNTQTVLTLPSTDLLPTADGGQRQGLEVPRVGHH